MSAAIKFLVLIVCVPGLGPGDDSERSVFCGVGVSLERAGQSTIITRVIEGGPAAGTNLPSGSLLIAVDGQPMRGLPLEEVVNRIKGPAGSVVVLRICDPDGKVQDVRLVRAQFAIPGKYGRGTRIDYILASPDLAEKCTRARVVNDAKLDNWSDHYPVMADFAVSPSKAGGGESESAGLRVITYNVLKGFDGRPECRTAIARWLKEQKPAVVAFQELNGFTQRDLKQWARAWGHTHVRILKKKGYPTGITSSEPISDLQKHFDGYWHGLMHCRTHGISFYVVHMAPGTGREKNRLQEAKRLLALTGPAENVETPTIILGDFNATSASDRAFYLKVGLLPNAVPTHAMDAFRKAGYVDLAAMRRPDDDAPIISIPTPLGRAVSAEEAKGPGDKKN